MNDCFVDSSALVKNYVREAGSAVVRRLLDPAAQATITVAQITTVEVVAALMRCGRRGDIAHEDAETLAAEFLWDVRNRVDVVPTSDAIVDASVALTRQHVLRAYDAVQLATAVATRATRVDRGLPPVVLVCSDRELNAAARAEGLDVLDPTQ